MKREQNIHRQTDIATTRPTRHRGPSWWKFTLSHVTCNLSPIPCHMSLEPTATATGPLPAKAPICTVGWFAKTQNPQIKFKKLKFIDTAKLFWGMPILAIHSLTKSLESKPYGHTDIGTTRLNRPENSWVERNWGWVMNITRRKNSGVVWAPYSSYCPICIFLWPCVFYQQCVCNLISLPSKLNPGVKLESATG